MNKQVELPLTDALYSTYHHQGSSTAIIVSNPTIRNWYLNERMNLTCNRKFLNGFTTPEIAIPGASFWDCPYFEIIGVNSRFIGGHINKIIRNMLDEGYYVIFDNIDDYYIAGKTWYHERHFNHDGMICGYDQIHKTYCLYSYDQKWLYRKFWTSQRCFNKAREAMKKQGIFSNFYAIKARENNVEFSPKRVYDGLKQYLDSNLQKYPFNGEGSVFGIAVHVFIAKYVTKLYCGDIPYERMDTRVFRLIWEHKKAMHERIQLVEERLGMNYTISQKYAELVKEADIMRMLYASHHMKRRDSVLPIIEKKLKKMMKDERVILRQLLKKMERRFKNESVEISDE